MKRLPNINFTEEEFSYIYEMNRYNFGGEAIILQSDNGKTLYKIFVDRKYKYIRGMSENKLKKINKLYQLNLTGCVKPLSSITIDKHLVGYEMTYDKDDITVTDSFLSTKELINILKRSKDILEKFKEQEIIYGDIKGNNILFNTKTKEIKFCDMDNICISDLPIDLYSRVLKKFINEYGRIDFNSSIYMHNLFTLQSLKYPNDYASYEGIVSSLKKGIYPQFIDEDGVNIINGMCTPKEFNGKFLIKSIKR